MLASPHWGTASLQNKTRRLAINSPVTKRITIKKEPSTKVLSRWCNNKSLRQLVLLSCFLLMLAKNDSSRLWMTLLFVRDPFNYRWVIGSISRRPFSEARRRARGSPICWIARQNWYAKFQFRDILVPIPTPHLIECCRELLARCGVALFYTELQCCKSVYSGSFPVMRRPSLPPCLRIQRERLWCIDQGDPGEEDHRCWPILRLWKAIVCQWKDAMQTSKSKEPARNQRKREEGTRSEISRSEAALLLLTPNNMREPYLKAALFTLSPEARCDRFPTHRIASCVLMPSTERTAKVCAPD